MDDATKFTLLGTDNWKSYAYFQAGVQWDQQGEKHKAQQMFLKALDQDPKNYGASFNLSVLDVKAQEYERALQRLERVRGAAWTKSVPSERTSVWYAALYWLAITYLYMHRLNPQSDSVRERLLSKAEKEATELTNTIEVVLRKISHRQNRVSRRQSHADRALKRYLERIQPIAEIVHAGIAILSANSSAGEREAAILRVESIERSAAEVELSYRTRYNLACFYSRLGMKTQDLTEKAQHYATALVNLKYALEADVSLAQWACKDPGLMGYARIMKLLSETTRLHRLLSAT